MDIVAALVGGTVRSGGRAKTKVDDWASAGSIAIELLLID